MTGIETKKNNINENNSEINFSPEQQKAFEEYLKEKEKKEITNFTKQELEKLKQEFLESQKYPQSSSNILKGTKFEKNAGSENFEKITKAVDNSVYEYFFQKPGILADKNIPEKNKKIFSSGASIFFMNNLAESIKGNGNLGKLIGFIDKFNSKKIGIKDIIEGQETKEGAEKEMVDMALLVGKLSSFLEKTYSPEKVSLLEEVLKNPEISKSNIFENPNSAFQVLEKIFTKNESKENILKFILEEKSEYNGELKNLGEKIAKLAPNHLAGGLLSLSSEIGEKIENIKEGVLGNSEIIDSLATLMEIPIIGGIIKAILEVFGLTPEELEKAKEKNLNKIKTKIIEKGSFLEGNKISENFGKNSDGKIDNSFVADIIKISDGNKDSEKNLEKLFQKGGDFENFIKNEKIKEIPGFTGETKIVNKDNEIIFKNFKNLTSHYKDFLEEKNKNGSQVTDLESFIKLKKEKEEKYNFKKTENKTNTTSQEKTKPQENKNEFLITANEGLEIDKNQGINFVFSHNGQKYEFRLNKNGDLQATGNGKQINFSGEKEIFDKLNSFAGKLDKNAEASDFGKNLGFINPNLGGSVKDILINGYKDEKGLKQIISEAFLKNGELQKEKIQITFDGKNYEFNA